MISVKPTSIILAVMVIVCPIGCTVGVCHEHDSVEEQSIECRCCHQEQPGDNPSPPNNCQCNDCLCNGALPLNQISKDPASVQYLPMLAVIDMFSLGDPSKSVRRIIRHSTQIPVDVTAVAARAVLSCWTL